MSQNVNGRMGDKFTVPATVSSEKSDENDETLRNRNTESLLLVNGWRFRQSLKITFPTYGNCTADEWRGRKASSSVVVLTGIARKSSQANWAKTGPDSSLFLRTIDDNHRQRSIASRALLKGSRWDDNKRNAVRFWITFCSTTKKQRQHKDVQNEWQMEQKQRIRVSCSKNQFTKRITEEIKLYSRNAKRYSKKILPRN